MDKIVRVLEVIDTREYELIGERSVPVAGSGLENECGRCGRLHVVHAHVLTDSGKTATVGTGCMVSESLEIQKTVKRLASRAKKVAALKAEIAVERARLDRVMAIRSAVLGMPAPEVFISEGKRYWCDDAVIASCGGVEVWDTRNGVRDFGIEQLKQKAICDWRVEKEREAGGGDSWVVVRNLKSLESKLRNYMK